MSGRRNAKYTDSTTWAEETIQFTAVERSEMT